MAETLASPSRSASIRFLGVIPAPAPARRAVFYLAALGFAVRLGVRLHMHAGDFWNGGYTLFLTLAHNIAAGQGIALVAGYPTAFRVPGYPIFLAAVTLGRQAFLPLAVAQSLVGAGTVWCAGLLAAEMFGPSAAVLAAGIAAFYPYYVVHDTALQETGLFTLLTAVAVILLRRARAKGTVTDALGAGLVLGLDVLTRATIAPFAATAPIWLYMAQSPETAPGKRLRSAAICAGVLALTVAPWLVRNFRLTGSATLSTETGLELWTGNNPLTFSHYPRESSDLSKAAALDALTEADRAEIVQAGNTQAGNTQAGNTQAGNTQAGNTQAGNNEATVDRWFWRTGVSYIKNHRARTILNGFQKNFAAFGWLPSPRRGFWPDLVYALSDGPVMLLGLFGMWLRRKHFREDSIIYLGFVWFFAVTALFFGHTSHRAYLDFYWIVFAAGVLAGLKASSAEAPSAEESPELKLLFCCARADSADASGPVKRKLDWTALADAAEYHGLAPIMHRVVDSVGPGLVPEEVAARLRESYRDSARRNLILTDKLIALLDAFKADGIALVPLKGPVLAESLYADPVLRPFSDLDLLVRKPDVPAAVRVLTREGYRLGPHLARLPLRTLLRLNVELLFRQEGSGQVDLQWEIGPADYPFRFDTEILWRSISRAAIAGREVPSVSPDSLLVFLCVHGAKHMWSRLQWLGDVARLVPAQPDWARTLELATEAGCVRPMLLGLLLAHDLLGTPIPEVLLERARAERTVAAGARQVGARLRRIAPAEPGSLELTAFNARLAERTWQKVRHCAALLKAPTEVELELLPLPPPLFWLYYPLRVARLALKYARR